jgi:L-fuconolactonase
MEVIDAQLHAWIPDTRAYPWDDAFAESVPAEVVDRFQRAHVPIDRVVALMDATGVDAALLTSPGLYGPDHRYAFEAASRYPRRFGVVGPLTPEMPDLAERIATYREQPWGAGIRLIVYANGEPVARPKYRVLFAAAQAAGVPVFITAMGMLREIASVAREFPDVSFVLDHLGLSMVGVDADRSSMIPDLLALARFPNITLKCTRAPEVLSTGPYPFDDLWPALHQILDAFGANRVMWGSDITQYPEVTYAEALDFIKETPELSASEKELILGKALRRIVDWDQVIARAEGTTSDHAVG